MSATEPLIMLIGINPLKLSKEENILLEIDLFYRICEKLIELFREQYREYFLTMKVNIEMENAMFESKLTRFIVQDILSTGEYNLTGIAHYTQTHEDVLCEIYSELNTQPSAIFFRKLIGLHRSVRRELYQEITKKIAQEYLSAA